MNFSYFSPISIPYPSSTPAGIFLNKFLNYNF